MILDTIASLILALFVGGVIWRITKLSRELLIVGFWSAISTLSVIWAMVQLIY